MALFPASSGGGGVHKYHKDITSQPTALWTAPLYYRSEKVNVDVNPVGKTIMASYEDSANKPCWTYISAVDSTSVTVGLVRPDGASVNLTGRVNVVIYD